MSQFHLKFLFLLQELNMKQLPRRHSSYYWSKDVQAPSNQISQLFLSFSLWYLDTAHETQPNDLHFWTAFLEAFVFVPAFHSICFPNVASNCQTIHLYLCLTRTRHNVWWTYQLTSTILGSIQIHELYLMKEFLKDEIRIRLRCHLLLSWPFLLSFNQVWLVAGLVSQRNQFISRSVFHYFLLIKAIVKMDIVLLVEDFHFYLSYFRYYLQSDLVLFSNFYSWLIISHYSKNYFYYLSIIVLKQLFHLLLKLNEFFYHLKLNFL